MLVIPLLAVNITCFVSDNVCFHIISNYIIVNLACYIGILQDQRFFDSTLRYFLPFFIFIYYFNFRSWCHLFPFVIFFQIILTCWDIFVYMLSCLCSLLNKVMINWAELNLFRTWWSCFSRSAHILQSHNLTYFSLSVKLSHLHSVSASASAILNDVLQIWSLSGSLIDFSLLVKLSKLHSVCASTSAILNDVLKIWPLLIQNWQSQAPLEYSSRCS